MSLSHPHWKVSRNSASLVWEISQQLKVFSCFPLPKFDLFFYLTERRASATNNVSEANCVVFGWFLINVRKNCYFWSCSISHSFVGKCDIYLENCLLNFYLVLTSKKRHPFIFLHCLLCLSYKITHHLLNSLELEYASFYHCRKLFPLLFVVRKLIFYLHWNHQQICKECSQTQNIHLLYRKLLPKCRPFS